MKWLTTILLILGTLVSCNKPGDIVPVIPPDPASSYIQFVSNSSRTASSASWGQATFTVSLQNSKDLKIISMYQSNDTYETTLSLKDGNQTFTINTIPLNQSTVSYYFQLTTKSDQVIKGGYFTARF